MKHNHTSTYLLILVGILLLVNFVMIFFLFRTVGYLKYDARTINQLGVIRGSIQRITKLELSGHQDSYDSLIQETEQLIETYLSHEQQNLFAEGYEDFNTNYISDIESKWKKLKKHLIVYREKRTDNLLQAIISESEDCWKAADFAVLKAQSIAEGKVSEINFFYIIFFGYAINTLIVIWIIYTYVRKNLEFRASHDSLTGLLNRHLFQEYMEKELERSKRYNHKFALILFDIDFFKKINDTYGHKTGDKILVELAQTVKNSLRKTDRVFRVGGEEFAIIVPEVKVDTSAVLAEKVRKGIENNDFCKNIKMTISLGVAESNSEETVSEIYRQADEALYKAKNTGRNKVEKYTRISSTETSRNSINH